MNAKKCDRCGKFYDFPSITTSIEVREFIDKYGTKTWDLCYTCRKELEEFLKGGNKND